ncbi:MAG: TIGR00730 family Rossman fold protein [Acidobacteria bacterium]|nr:TIGR00730 family Rossman fold protein [Acidobacteriota bacterium]
MATLSICVYCASSGAVDEAYFQAAREVGAEIGRRGRRLIYGGTDVGLMGAVAAAAREAGAEVHGVIPEAIRQVGIAAEWVDELVVTPDLRARKAEMERRADAFLALPGGFGTLEELFEAITQRQLRAHNKPIVLLNTAGFFDPLLALFEELYQRRFARSEHRQLYAVARDPVEALDLAEAPPAEPLPPKWFSR